MIARRLSWLLPTSLLLCLLASSASAGTVTGTVRNGTTGKPAVGVEIILIQLQGGMQPVANTKTDSDGHYKFDNPGLGAGPMLIRAVYRGVNYHEPATPDKTTIDMQVYEPTDKPSAISVAVHAIIAQPEGSDLAVTEEYSISNKTQPPLAYYRADGDFDFSLPQGAELRSVSAGAATGMPVVQSPVDKGSNSRSIAYPFRPGDSQVSLTYKLPYPANQASLRLISRYAVDHLGVFVPPSVQVSGGGLEAAGQAQGFSAYTRNSVAANTPVSFSVSGTAPPPTSSQEGAAAEAPDNDNSQNASVNSRIDTGAEAPVASMTTLPARLDSLKWILVGGFAALFVLGVIYLWMQPQASVAGLPAGARARSPGEVPAKTAYKTPQVRIRAPEESIDDAALAAGLDREVRGSLDELKDILFRLELRREAGTITEADYTRERDRVQNALRDLVKG
jgi:hypothetical protein